jgi:Fibronectin type III domain
LLSSFGSIRDVTRTKAGVGSGVRLTDFISLGVVRRALALGGIGLLVGGSLSQAQETASVTLAWDPPSGASGIAGYRVYYGTSSGSYPQIINVGNTTTATVSNLVSGQTYYFVVTDYNTAGLESAPSNQASFTTGTGPPSITNVLPSYVVTTVPNPLILMETANRICCGEIPPRAR